MGEPVHCTGVLAREAFDEFGLSTDAILNELTTVRFYAPTAANDRLLDADRRSGRHRPPAVRPDGRGAATDAGVRVHCGDRVSSVEVGADGVTVRAGDDGRARACVRAGVRRELRDPAAARARHSAAAAALGAGRAAGLAARRRRGALRRARRAARLRLGGAGRPRRPAVRSRRRHVRSQCRTLLRADARATCRRAGASAPPRASPRQKILPLGPIDRTYARPGGRARRRGRPRQADDGRGHLLQPGQRERRGRRPRRRARGRRSAAPRPWRRTRRSGASGSDRSSAGSSCCAASPSA